MQDPLPVPSPPPPQEHRLSVLLRRRFLASVLPHPLHPAVASPFHRLLGLTPDPLHRLIHFVCYYPLISDFDFDLFQESGSAWLHAVFLASVQCCGCFSAHLSSQC